LDLPDSSLLRCVQAQSDGNWELSARGKAT